LWEDFTTKPWKRQWVGESGASERGHDKEMESGTVPEWGVVNPVLLDIPAVYFCLVYVINITCIE
jgi:hypothetical protein